MHRSAECNFRITVKLLIHTVILYVTAIVSTNSHLPPKQCCLCRVRQCKLSLATVLESLKSLPMDDSRRVAFSEEVINSHAIVAYLCVWAAGRLGLAACLACVAMPGLPARPPPRSTQSQHRTHLAIYCQRLSGRRADSVHTATPEMTQEAQLSPTDRAMRRVR